MHCYKKLSWENPGSFFIKQMPLKRRNLVEGSRNTLRDEKRKASKIKFQEVG